MTRRCPKVSVVIPVYNGKSVVSRAIEGALNQDFSDFEMLIIDDASTDDSRQIVMNYQDTRIRHYRNNRNIGFSHNLQRGLELAQGEYLIYLCQDDFWYPQLLKKEAEFLDGHPEVGFVHTANHTVHKDKIVAGTKGFMKPWPRIMPGTDFFVEVLTCNRSVGLSTVMARRTLMVDLGGFDTELSWSTDVAMRLRLSLSSRVAYINEYLAANTLPAGYGGELSRRYFAQKRYFEDPLFLLSKVFAWPEVKREGLESLREIAIRKHATSMIYFLHMLRAAGLGRREVVDLLVKSANLYGQVLLLPQTWIRFFISLSLSQMQIKLGRFLAARWRQGIWSVTGKLK